MRHSKQVCLDSTMFTETITVFTRAEIKVMPSEACRQKDFSCYPIWRSVLEKQMMISCFFTAVIRKAENHVF